MPTKTQLLTLLRDELNRWEEMLAHLSEAQITAPPRASDLSIKDVIAHLRAWQQVSIARMQAALHNREPEFPDWLQGQDPESDEQTDEYNARIFESYRAQTWASVHQVWREGFLHFLELAEQIPKQDLLVVGRYAWLKEYPLAAVLEGSLGHHREHFEALLVWTSQQKN